MHILVDGAAVPAFPGQSVAVALLAAGIASLRSSPRLRAPRGAFCLTGVCQECLVDIEGSPALACQVLVRPALAVSLGRADD